MKSKISFFNKTIFLKNVTLYWPIWVVYTLFLLGGLPVTLWFSTQYIRETNWTEQEMANELYYVIQPTYYICVIAFAAVIIGMALFSYLYKSQSANMIHSLPVDRTELFGTNVISGLAFLIVPQIVTFILAVLVCLNAGITKVEYLAMWLIVVMVTAFIAFSFVTVCAFFTGQLAALPIYVVIINFLAYAVNYMIQLMVGMFGYGVNMSSLLSDEIIIWFSPLICYLRNVQIDYVSEYHIDYTDVTRLELEGIPCMIIYFLIAIALYAIAYVVYRKRKIESAGDLITVGFVKPLFRWGVGTLAGFYITMLFYALFMEIGMTFSIPVFVIVLLIFGSIFYFVADMFVRKTFRVFKRQNLKGCGMFCGVLLLSFVVMYIYTDVEEHRIPDDEDLEYATINMNYTSDYDGERIKIALEIHEKILEDVDYYEELYWKNYPLYYYDIDYEWIGITYKTKDGTYISRDYRIPDEGPGAEVIDMIEEIENQPENILESWLGKNYDEASNFYYGYLYINGYYDKYDDAGMRLHDDMSTELTTSQSQTLFQAIIADAKEGTLSKYNGKYWNEDVPVDECTWQIQLEYMVPGETTYDGFSTSYYDAYQYVDITFGKDCKNIISAIADLGLQYINSEDDIMWYEDGENKPVPEISLKNFISYDYDKVDVFIEGWLEIGYYAGEEYGNNPLTEYDNFYEITVEKSEILYEAIIADWLEGKMLKYNYEGFANYEGPIYYGEENVFSVTVVYQQPGDWINTSVTANFGSDCEHIIDALVDIGVVESEEDICWENIGWSVQLN